VAVVSRLDEGHVGKGDEKAFSLSEVACSNAGGCTLPLLVIRVVNNQKRVAGEVFDGSSNLISPVPCDHHREEICKQGLLYRVMDQWCSPIGKQQLLSFTA